MRWYYKGIFPSENVIVSHLTYGYEGLSSSSSHSVFLVSPVGNKYLVYFIRALVFDICLFVIYQSKVPRRRVLLRPHACLDSVIFRFQSIVDAEREQLEHFPEIVLTSLACWQQVGGKKLWMNAKGSLYALIFVWHIAFDLCVYIHCHMPGPNGRRCRTIHPTYMVATFNSLFVFFRHRTSAPCQSFGRMIVLMMVGDTAALATLMGA